MPLASLKASALATLGAVLVAESDFGQSRRAVVVLAGSGAARQLALGAVLGAALFAAPVIAAAGGNDGNGTLGALALGDAAKVGVYTCTCIAAAADGGRFQVVDPDGYRLADAVVGVAYVGPQIAFTIADGADDFAVGDVITVTVPAGSGKVVALDPAAHDGTQLAFGVLAGHVTAPDGADADGWALTRDAVLKASGLVWPAGISDGAKAAALARLDAGGLFVVSAI